jgi:putative membrane protein
MKRVARVLAVVGLALAGVLFARENVARIALLVAGAIPGLLLAASFHVVPMIANARAWQHLFAARPRPRMRVLTHAVWIRESVNGVLPVARIGGEIAAYRILRHVASRADAAASLAADVALSVLSQSAFALLGVAMLIDAGRTGAIGAELVTGVAAMIVLGAAFVLAQRMGALAGIAAFVDRVAGGRLGKAKARSLGIDQALRSVHARRRDVAACLAWQLAAWLLGAGEIWLALYFLGEHAGLHEAIAIEALIQAISSAAFVVPGALGVQEAAFMLIGGALGLDATTSLALAAARRLRDVVIFIPGLVAWHRAEMRRHAISAARRSASSK